MPAQPYMPWFERDWRSKESIGKLSAEARGVWREFLGMMHMNESYSVTGTPRELAKENRLETAEVERAIIELEKYDVCDVSRLVTGEVTLLSRRRYKDDKVRKSACIRQRDKRKRDKEKKNNKNVTLDVHDNSLETENEIEYEIDLEEKERKSFDKIYDAYGKKIGKVSARKAWSRISKKDHAVIFEHIPRFVQATPDKKFRPNLSTYLNQRLFEDEELPSFGVDNTKLFTHKEMLETGKSTILFEAIPQEVGKPLWKLTG